MAAAAAPASLDLVPRPAGRCAWQVLDGEAVVIDLAGRRVMGLNPAGSFLWSRADASLSVRALAALLASEFAIPVDAAERDTAAFIGLMLARGLMQRAEAGRQP